MKKITIILLIVIVVSLSVSLYRTFATDITIDKVSENGADIIYNVNLIEQLDRSVSVSAGNSKIVDLLLKNSNSGTIKYGIGYKIDSIDNSGVSVAQLYNSKDKITDFIEKDGTKQISIIIENNSANDVTLTLVAITGYENGGELIVPKDTEMVTETHYFYKDSSGANAPELMSGMVPIEYLTTNDGVEQDGWYVADTTTEWYNYNEQRWANAVLVTEESGLREAGVGTLIPEDGDDILAYYVWIPRYKYQLFNANKNYDSDLDEYYEIYDYYDSRSTGVNIIFESGVDITGEVICSVYLEGTDAGEETCENAEDGKYYTHPAFWWDSNDNGIREIGEELTGIWIGKFEISSSDPSLEYGGGSTNELSVRVKPNVHSWTNNNISNFFTVIQNMVKHENNVYGISNNETDSHMIKNMEWGAVGYLTHSKYGRCVDNSCKDVDFCGNIDLSEANIYKIGNGNYKENLILSTTNNITGVYDLDGTNREAVMGNMVNNDGTNMLTGNIAGKNSGFNGQIIHFNYTDDTMTAKNIIGGIDYPNKRYYDVYKFSNNIEDWWMAHLGDAVSEIVEFGDVNGGALLYGGHILWIDNANPWVTRGESDNNCTSNGYISQFSAFWSFGDGSMRSNVSTRSILIKTPWYTSN